MNCWRWAAVLTGPARVMTSTLTVMTVEVPRPLDVVSEAAPTGTQAAHSNHETCPSRMVRRAGYVLRCVDSWCPVPGPVGEKGASPADLETCKSPHGSAEAVQRSKILQTPRAGRLAVVTASVAMCRPLYDPYSCVPGEGDG